MSQQYLTPADLEFRRETEVALRDAPPAAAAWLLAGMIAVLVAFFCWAHFALVEEVARGEGKVIPSSKTQVIQSLEGGLVKAMLVVEGQRVEKGQVLLRIDDTGFSSEFGGMESKAQALRAQLTRLSAEIDGIAIENVVFSADLKRDLPKLIDNEIQLFKSRTRNLDQQLVTLQARKEQRNRELSELQETRKRLDENVRIAEREFALKKPMAARGVVPKTDMLVIERTLSDLRGQRLENEQAIPRVAATIREVESQIGELGYRFQEDAQREYNERSAELAVVEQQIRAARDRVVRADIRSPVTGIVNKVHNNTIGGVVRAGDPIIEVTPVEDNLLVQARVRPQDVAFIHPGQKAVVKITAYDFTIYGGLDGKVELISSDSSIDEQTREAYYEVTVRTDKTALEKAGQSLPIMPGMVASVDILTGEKTILDYLLKPINKARYEALRER